MMSHQTKDVRQGTLEQLMIIVDLFFGQYKTTRVLVQSVLLLAGCMFITIHSFSQSVEKYPDLDQEYSKKQLNEYLQYYQNRHDTLGVIYTYMLWRNVHRYLPFDEEKKIISTIYKNRNLVRRHSEYNYNALLLELSDYHDQNYKGLMNSVRYCDSVMVYSQRHKKSLMARKALVTKMYLLFDLQSDTIGKALPTLYSYRYLWPKYPYMKTEYNYLAGFADLRAKRYQEAIISFEQVLKLIEGSGYDVLKHLSVLFLAQCHRLNKNYTKASHYALRGMRMGSNINNSELNRWVYQELAMIKHQQKEYKQSSDYWLKYWEFEEKIRLNNVQKLNTTGLNFELLEAELQQSNLQEKLNEQEIAQKKLLTDSLLVMCLLLLLLLVVGIVTYLQKIRLGNQEKQMALYQGQEQERNYIARELHDDVGSTLAGIKTQIPPSLPNFALLSRHLDYVYQKIKTLSHTLHTDDIEQIGLPQACQDFINLIDRQGIIIFSVYGQEVLLPAFEVTMIYRVIQELLTNTLHHAQASEVYFNLYFGTNEIQIGIEDNGKGLKRSNSSGIGLANIQKRVALLGGKIEISTGTDGTTFFILIPFDKFLVKTLNGN